MTTEWRFIQAFAQQFRRCGLHDGETVVVLSESQSRVELVETARLAAQSITATVIEVVMPTPRSAHPVPIRSTGASQAIAGNRSVIEALRASDLVLDCTVEGLLHAPELAEVLGGRCRVLMISNEHLDTYDRLGWDEDLPRRVERAHRRLRAAATMHATSPAGTDLTVSLAGAFAALERRAPGRPGAIGGLGVAGAELEGHGGARRDLGGDVGPAPIRHGRTPEHPALQGAFGGLGFREGMQFAGVGAHHQEVAAAGHEGRGLGGAGDNGGPSGGADQTWTTNSTTERHGFLLGFSDCGWSRPHRAALRARRPGS